MTQSLRATALGCLLLSAACTTLPLPDPKFEGTYGLALAKATRKVTLYEGLETRAFVRATYLSPEFVTVQAAELSRMRAEPPGEAAQRLAKMLDDNKVPSFFVAFYTPQKEWNDWQDPSSIWRLAVDLGHGQIEKPKVVRIDRPDAETLALYPYFDVYSVGYYLRFTGEAQPSAPGASVTSDVLESAMGQVQLVAAGSLGLIKIAWTLPGARGNASR